MPVFRDRFNQLRGDMTQAQFAKFLGMSRATVGFYCSGERVPDAIILRDIAEKCKVSIDWLLGLTDSMPADEEVKVSCNYTGLDSDAIQWINVIKKMKGAAIDIGLRKENELHEIDVLSMIFNASYGTSILGLLEAILEYPKRVDLLLDNMQPLFKRIEGKEYQTGPTAIGNLARECMEHFEAIRSEDYKINNAAMFFVIAHDLAGSHYDILMKYNENLRELLTAFRGIKSDGVKTNGKDD